MCSKQMIGKDVEFDLKSHSTPANDQAAKIDSYDPTYANSILNNKFKREVRNLIVISDFYGLIGIPPENIRLQITNLRNKAN